MANSSTRTMRKKKRQGEEERVILDGQKMKTLFRSYAKTKAGKMATHG